MTKEATLPKDAWRLRKRTRIATHVLNTHPFKPEHRRKFDRAARKVYYKFESWNGLADVMEIYTGLRIHVRTLCRHMTERTLPLAYACWIVDLMQGEITLLDFFPQLEDYVVPVQKPQSKQGDTPS